MGKQKDRTVTMALGEMEPFVEYLCEGNSKEDLAALYLSKLSSTDWAELHGEIRGAEKARAKDI